MDDNNKKKKKKDELPAAGWEVIYCSLALILVAFFAMLVSYSKVEGNQMINFLRGFGGEAESGNTWSAGSRSASQFINVYTGGTRGSGKSSSVGRPTIPEISDGDKAATPGKEEKDNIVNIYTGGDQGSGDDGILRSLGNLSDNSEEKVTLSMEYLIRHFEKAGLSGEVDVAKTENGFKVTITSGILFPSGAATITDTAYPSLERIVKLVNAVPYMMRIEGHTDNVPIHTDTYPSNWELSTARAVNVLRYFLDTGKVSPGRIAAVGFGEYHPVAPNATSEGRRKNRRVDFYFAFVDKRESLSRRGME